MSAAVRPVDRAMGENRIPKKIVRSLWIEEIMKIHDQYDDESTEPLYLTLPGAEGHDIQLLIDNELISLTEVKSISEIDQKKIVAVESNNKSVLSLQKKFIGLKIKEVNFINLIHGEELFSWPPRRSEDEICCRAKVINLDLDSPLQAKESGVFPVLRWIYKLCQIHTRPSPSDWTLFLTLHGELRLPSTINTWLREFLIDNMSREKKFNRYLKYFLGKDLYLKIKEDVSIDFNTFDREDMQRLIMVIVPKIIAMKIHNNGWRVRTEKNLCYGSEGNAPMVTWIIKFIWNGATTVTPDSLYRSSIKDIFLCTGRISNDGVIIPCNIN